MDLERNPPLLDHLASAYALGTLRGGARRRFQTLARRSPRVRAAALLWQERLTALTEVEAVAPSPEVWKRIANMLPPEAPAPLAQPVVQPLVAQASAAALRFWRSLAAGAALAAVLVAGVGWNLWTQSGERGEQLAQARQQAGQLAQRNQELLAQAQGQPEIRYVSVLSDERAGAFLLALYDPKHSRFTLQRVGSYAEGPDRSLQLWALPPAPGTAPQSLGVLGEGGVMHLPAPAQAVGQVPALALTLEPKGGVSGGPTGPVLFKGPLLRTPI
jgi:anti-sigma-K factor RskA